MELCCLWQLVLAISVAIAGYLLFYSPKSESIFGVYRQKGRFYCFKFSVMYIFLSIRQWYFRNSDGVTSMGRDGKFFQTAFEMEKIQPLSSDPKAVDAIFFTGASRDGYYCVVAFARRPKRTANAFALLKLPNDELLIAHHLPDTTIKTDSDYSYEGEGFDIKMIRPFAKWAVKYDGKMKHVDAPDKLVDVKLDLTWESQLRYFDFNVNMNPALLARAIAKEPWSRKLFAGLKESHQNHYEQMGLMNGTVEIDGQNSVQVRFTHSYRDHSFSHKREWKQLHRYILHNVTVDDGTRFMVGIISIPMSFSTLELGYVYNTSGKLVSIDWCDLPMWYFGENGTAPKLYAFSFGTADKTYTVQVKVESETELFIGLKKEARILERLCTFQVNDRPGWGFAEWEYRNSSKH